MSFDEHSALRAATYVASLSPCAKSKRGVVIFNRIGVCAQGYNGPPPPFACTGDDACKSACSKICIHAEQAALIQYDDYHGEVVPHMLHVEVVDGKPVPSGPPSCWQCSRLLLATTPDIAGIWLLHDGGLKLYDPVTFHRETLLHCGLPLNEVSDHASSPK